MEFYSCPRCHFRSKSYGMCTICGFNLSVGVDKVVIEQDEEMPLVKSTSKMIDDYWPVISQKVSSESKNIFSLGKGFCLTLYKDLIDFAVKTKRASRKMFGLLFHA